MQDLYAKAKKQAVGLFIPCVFFGLSIVSCVSFQLRSIEHQSQLRASETSDVSQVIGFASTLSSIGYDGLSASALWIDFIQYFGDRKNRENGIQRSADYLNALSTVEPRFIHTYDILLSALGMRTGQPDVAKHILQRGMNYITPEWNPQAYKLPFNLAIFNFLFLGDLEASKDNYNLAADWYEHTRDDSAETWRRLGNSLSQNSRSRLAQYAIWSQVHSNLRGDPEAQAFAQMRLAELGTIQIDAEGNEYFAPPPLEN